MGTMAIIINAMAPTTMVHRPNLIAATFAGLVALVCGGIAILSLHAAIVALPAGDIIAQLRSGEPVSRDARMKAADASFRAGEIFEPGRYFGDAALAAAGLTSADQRLAMPGQSVRAIVDRGLVAAPASPHNWVRRAALQFADGDLRGAAKSLDTSLLLGRFTPGLTVPRLRLMFLVARRLPDASLNRAIDDQIRVAALTEPYELARLADGGTAEGVTQRVLSTDFELYRAYLSGLAQVRSEKKAAETAAVR